MRHHFVYPDALPGGWDRIDAIAPGLDSDETEPGHPRLELPRGVPGRIGQLLDAARGVAHPSLKSRNASGSRPVACGR